jgi:phosphatidylglycerophosphate synthase
MNAVDTPLVSEFREAPRDLRGLTTGLERAALRWLVPRVPAWLTPDRLTGTAFASMLAGGLLYWMSARRPGLLHAVNACLFVNWLGDSLDGAVAKHRGRAQPRYGFYIDHMLDNVGVAALLGGLCASGLVAPALGAVVVVLYLLFQLHMHMSVYTRGVFQMSFAGVGGTEMRLLLVLGNLAVLVQPRWAVFGYDVRPYDAIAAPAALLLVGSLVVTIVRTAIELEHVDAAERR